MKLFSILRNPLVSTLGVSLVVFGWRPFRLGFYSDDYTLFVTPLALGVPPPEIAQRLLSLFVNRPLTGLWTVLSVSLCQGDPFAWHLMLSMQAIAAALAVTLLVKKINVLIGFSDPITETMLGWLWPLLPFTYGFLAWPTYSSAGICFLSFIAAMLILLSTVSFRVPMALLAFGVSLFTLEHFYFQLFPLLGLVLWKRRVLGYKRSELGWLAFGLLAIQIGALSFNRLIQKGITKTLDPEFIFTRIKSSLMHPEYWHHIAIPLSVATGMIVIIWNLIRRWQAAQKVSPGAGLMLIALAGSFFSAGLCLAAGYSIRPFGLGSRTSMVFSLWLVVFLLGLCLQFNSLSHQRLLLGALIGLLLPVNIWQGKQWAGSWEKQKKVLADVPVASFSQLPSGACVVGLVPNYQGDVLVFDEDWTLGPAIISAHPALKNKNLRFIPHKNSGFSKADLTFSDGKISRVSKLSGHKLGDIQAKDLYLWNSYSGNLFRVASPWHLPVNQDPFQVGETNLLRIL